jgi:hypothetical protein
VNASLANGTLLAVDAAELTGTSTLTGGSVQARATAATLVNVAPLLSLSVSLSPDIILPSETMTGTLSVSNTSGFSLFGVVLEARFPTDRVVSTYETEITGGGDCGSSTCDAGETVRWNLGTMTPGVETTVTIPLTVSNSAPLGTLITFGALVRDDTGAQASDGESARVGN